MIGDLVTALGLVLIIEGAIWSLAPHRLKRLMAMMEQMAPDALRAAGLTAAGAGLVLVWIGRNLLAGS